jgi:hypothetical protein
MSRVCDYRRGLDWWLDLLTTYTHNSWLHFTVHSFTQTSVLSQLVSTNRCFVTASNYVWKQMAYEDLKQQFL